MSTARRKFDALKVAIAQMDDAGGEGSGFFAVGGHEDRGSLLGSDTAQEIEDHGTGGGVEIARRLVGQKEARGIDEGAGDGDALHLAAGKLVRVAGGESGHLDPG